MATSLSARDRTNESSLLGKHYPKTIKWWRKLAGMTLFGFLLSFLFCPKCGIFTEDFVVTLGYTLCYTYGLWLANEYPNRWLNRKADWTQNPIRSFLITLGASMAASLLVISLVNIVFLAFYHHRPVSAIRWQNFIFPLMTTVVVSLFMHSRSFLLGWRDAAIRAERMEKESAVARLDSLRRQVDPHFLFNSLNALTSLVEEDPTRAVRFIKQLSQVYRYVLDSQDHEVVTLAEELRFSEAYLYLQRTRLGNGLDVQLDLPPADELENFMVPPLALQLLLENAIKHNVALQNQPLHIRIHLDETSHQLVVSNSLRPRRLAPGESTGLGLKNLEARYGFLTQQLVSVEKTEQEFIVTLPVLELV
ncbi:sensor histidine kinase [Hymenobacter sp. GOD-10R]|uniref:sensor histidine kinase n=1 Tax=Hymenobacter sp. GOD-10R TaxID=3093922 RepID=UPI002D765484|nr:histidine kinase [Hymenobacter sp. GOD-10R]WRQ30081.1 histidine kinase [Hymenobacter sp. GOD-10R]